MRIRSIVLIGLLMTTPWARAEEPAWLEVDGVVYGAKPDERGPIGGGAGYRDVVTGGDHEAKDLDSLRHQIHHNFIHHCQYNGLGYGVTVDQASALIEYNLFDWNRHSLAGTGRPGSGYIARHNVELGVSLSHCFDMHGGRDRKDGTDVAGTSIEIYNNTFRAPETPVVIRGVPEEKCDVYRNWFPRHAGPEQAVRAAARTNVFDNLYGPAPKEAQ